MPRKSTNPSVADEGAAPGGTAAVDRALSLLSAFRPGDRALGVTELAERTRLHKSTALRLLNSLAHAGLLVRDETGGWSPGPEIDRLAQVRAAAFPLEAVALPLMRALVDATQESVALHVRSGAQRLCLLRVDSPHLLRDHVRAGDLLPLERGAGGRVLLAFAGEPGALHEQIRREGHLVRTGDRVAGLTGISAPVWRSGGAAGAAPVLVGALTLTVPEPRMRPELVGALRETAARLSAALGAG